MGDDQLPDLLTVDEAARLIRVGRTKAYAMALEWRATGGRSGLPVIDFGHVLRVPRRALERVIGTELHGPVPDSRPGVEVAAPSVPTPVTPLTLAPDAPTRRRRPSRPAAQPALFEPPPAS